MVPITLRVHHVHQQIKHCLILCTPHEGREMQGYAQTSRVLSEFVLIAVFMAVSVETRSPGTYNGKESSSVF